MYQAYNASRGVMERAALDSHKLLVSRHYHLSNAAPGDT